MRKRIIKLLRFLSELVDKAADIVDKEFHDQVWAALGDGTIVVKTCPCCGKISLERKRLCLLKNGGQATE